MKTLFCVILVLSASAAVHALTNVALGKPATQSTTHSVHSADKAVDGIPGAPTWNNKCTHTIGGGEWEPWWRVDLQQTHDIQTVKLYNRPDCCPERLQNFEIRVGNNPHHWVLNPVCYASDLAVSNSGESFPCVATGRYVYVVLRKHEMMTICEAEVYGTVTSPQPPRIDTTISNWARGKNTAQSSTHSTYSSNYAIDGLWGTNPWSNQCTHSKGGGELNPWWRVDMGAPVPISYLTLGNRIDCCPERLQDFQIRVGNSPNWEDNAYCGSGLSVPAAGRKSFACGLTGRYVSIVLMKHEMMTICEAEVFVETSLGTNIALGKPATQSTTNEAFTADKAVDGFTDGPTWSDKCTHTIRGDEWEPWWRVDLTKKFDLTFVRLHTRQDCCRERLQNYEIRVGDNELHWALNPVCYASNEAVPSEGSTMPCQASGRYLYIVLKKSEYMTICEAEVYGTESASQPVYPTGRYLRRVGVGKPAAQISTHSAYSADLALDGVFGAPTWNGHCTHTSGGGNQDPWWRVDLEQDETIDVVTLSTRIDCCPERLQDFDIRVGSSPDWNQNPACGTGLSVPAAGTVSFPCGATGRYLHIVLRKFEMMTICEAELYVTEAPNAAPPTPSPASCTGGCLMGACSSNGQLITVTVTGIVSDLVWGTDYFTDDSFVGAAAVHAGVVAVGESQQITVRCAGPQSNFAASLKNGVQSKAYTSWPNSFSFDLDGATPQPNPPAPEICYREPCAHSKCNIQGSSFSIVVTGNTSPNIWGTNIHTDDSNVGSAAVHKGLLTAGESGSVTVKCTGAQASFTGSERHGVTTQSYGVWEHSFELEGGPVTPPPPTGPSCRGACVQGQCPLGTSRRVRVTGTTYGYGWGSSQYTDDSTVAMVAVHAGIVAAAETKDILISCVGAQTSFTGSSANSVTTQSYTAWPHAFTVAAAPTPTPTVCVGSCLHNVCGVEGTVHHLTVTGSSSGSVWGTSLYSDDSDVGTAAVHMGLVAVGATANLVGLCAGPQTTYESTTNAGILSKPYGSWPNSFTLQ